MRVSSLQIACWAVAVLVLVGAAAWGGKRRRARPAQLTAQPAAQPATQAAATAPTATTSASIRLTSQGESPEEQAARLEAMHRLHLLALSSQAVPPTDSPAHDELASRVRWTLASITDKPSYAPRRPLQLPRLVQAMNNEDVSRRELASIIASDPGLAAGLFRLANSPFYRASNSPIESLDRAVALLGIDGMRSLVAAALMQPVFDVQGGGFINFGDVIWQHTLASAAAAESRAVMLESADPFAAQLLALTTGLATIVVFKVTIDEYRSRQLPPHPRVLLTLIDSQTAQVAQQIAASWQLSERIMLALADQSAQGTPMSPLGRSLQFGRFLGALAVLHQRQVLDDTAVSAALQTGGSQASAYERVWGKRAAALQR